MRFCEIPKQKSELDSDYTLLTFTDHLYTRILFSLYESGKQSLVS
jgi:hypothetical protein